jgi:hypothetical protein
MDGLWARSSRVARHDGAPSWHGVSGLGASTESHPTLRLAVIPGEGTLEMRAYPTHGDPYLFGMVKKSVPSHKCVSEAHEVVLRQ